MRDYGAVGNGQVLDSPAIDRAIQAATNAGGGVVVVPAGKYLCGTIHLRSHITLQINKGATIIAARPRPIGRYDAPEPNPWANDQDFGHSHWANALITGSGLTDVTVTGGGEIDGWGLDHIQRRKATSPDKAISLVRCQNVTLSNLTIRHGGWFGVLATGVDDLHIEGLTIDTNRDGIDIDSCRRVTVASCVVNSPNDDAICLKSSFALGLARATEDVTIHDCQVSGFDEGTLLNGRRGRTKSHPTGRIKLGTESTGGFRNIKISDCQFEHCCGLNLATVDGGTLEDVSVQNVTMRDIVNSPVFIRLGARHRCQQDGALRRIVISGLTVSQSSQPILISGLPNQPIQDVTLSDISIAAKGGAPTKTAHICPPELASAYPEPASFGRLPASAVFIRHAHGVRLNNCRFTFVRTDHRPRVVVQDATGVDLLNVITDAGTPLQAMIEPPK